MTSTGYVALQVMYQLLPRGMQLQIRANSGVTVPKGSKPTSTAVGRLYSGRGHRHDLNSAEDNTDTSPLGVLVPARAKAATKRDERHNQTQCSQHE